MERERMTLCHRQFRLVSKPKPKPTETTATPSEKPTD